MTHVTISTVCCAIAGLKAADSAAPLNCGKTSESGTKFPYLARCWRRGCHHPDVHRNDPKQAFAAKWQCCWVNRLCVERHNLWPHSIGHWPGIFLTLGVRIAIFNLWKCSFQGVFSEMSTNLRRLGLKGLPRNGKAFSCRTVG